MKSIFALNKSFRASLSALESLEASCISVKTLPKTHFIKKRIYQVLIAETNKAERADWTKIQIMLLQLEAIIEEPNLHQLN